MKQRSAQCAPFEDLIALHVEGDLETEEAHRLQAHLADCADCQAWSAEMAASQAALRRHLIPPSDEQIQADIRTAVLAQIQAEKKTYPGCLPPFTQRFRPYAPWMALAATLLASVGLWRYHTVTRVAGPPVGPAALELPLTPPLVQPPPTIAPSTTQPPAIQPSLSDSQAREPQEIEPPIEVVESGQAASQVKPSADPSPRMAARLDNESMLIKIVSEDKKIVIYWLVEPTENKESENESETLL